MGEEQLSPGRPGGRAAARLHLLNRSPSAAVSQEEKGAEEPPLSSGAARQDGVARSYPRSTYQR